MTATKHVFHGAPVIDFTGTVSEFLSHSEFGEEFTAIVRGKDRPRAAIIIDRAVGMPIDVPVVVRDHLNLTGSSPLCGPNDPSGERFPVVQGIYIEDALPDFKHVVVAGLKPGVVPTAEEVALIKSLGAQTCCYNVVPAMLIAAHARCKVLAILLPEKANASSKLLSEINELIGAQ